MMKVATQVLRPKFILMTLVLLVSFGNQMKVSAGPIPDTDSAIETITKNTSNFLDRAQNTFSLDEKDKDKEKLTPLEIVLIAVAAFLVFMFLLCCIGYCLCECIKELICCVCCCKCCRD